MKIIPSSKRGHYVARLSIFLITVAFVVGMVGCGGESYALAVASTAGGSVTTPGEGAFLYEEGTVVNLVAEAEEGYRFGNWTGNVGTITNIESPTTTITMNGSYLITASFLAVYTLTISSTVGGSVTYPGEGSYAYDAGTTVSLVATPANGYRFGNWTGDVGTGGDVNAAATNITMSGNYFITASFKVISGPMLAAGVSHTVGLKSDGTVVAVGGNWAGQCDVDDWMLN